MTNYNRQETYMPAGIPPQITATIYTHYCISGYCAGRISIDSSDLTGDTYIKIAETPIYIEVPEVGNIKEKVIEALEQEKKNQLALHHKKMCEIQEKIDSLLVLTYQPSEA